MGSLGQLPKERRRYLRRLRASAQPRDEYRGFAAVMALERFLSDAPISPPLGAYSSLVGKATWFDEHSRRVPMLHWAGDPVAIWCLATPSVVLNLTVERN
jgi:hypothetical protein